MTENTFQFKLVELRQQFSTLQELSHEDPGQAKALPRVLSDLRRSLDELQTLVAELPEGPSASARTKVRRAKDPPVLTIVGDATTRKSAEQDLRRYQERLRALMADLLLAEERERRRLAIDLHDGLSQTIALTQLKVSALRVSLHGKLSSALDEIEELIDQTDRSVRSISFELSPPVLHDLGLEPAVHWLVENIQARYGIEIVLEVDGQPKPADEKVRVILFRSLRELLINAAKHSKARRIRVWLEREEGRLNVTVEDDGVGMESDVVAVRGSGLFSIHERLSHVGGSMNIESAPGQGTRIRMCAPLTSDGPTNARVAT